MSTDDHSSLGYIEDPYFNPHDSTITPSLDELDDVEYLDERVISENEVELFNLKQLDFDEITYNSVLNDDEVNVEVEFFNVKRANKIIRALLKKDFKRHVRVTYSDFTKPYLAKLPKDSNFRKYLDMSVDEEDLVAGEPVPEDLSKLSFEERQQQEAAWKAELAQIEDEINTLRSVLSYKVKRSAELKKNLGITVWKEISDDMNQGIKNVKESNVYQTVECKVGQVTKAVTDAPIYQKTTSIIGGITGNITNKLGQMRNSESFRSIEEKVGSAYENVKTKVSTSRSNSTQSLNEAGRSRTGSTVTSPVIDEEKPLA